MGHCQFPQRKFLVPNSKCIAQRIKGFITEANSLDLPPVDVDFFSLETQKKRIILPPHEWFPIKNTIVETFNELPHYN